MYLKHGVIQRTGGKEKAPTPRLRAAYLGTLSAVSGSAAQTVSFTKYAPFCYSYMKITLTELDRYLEKLKASKLKSAGEKSTVRPIRAVHELRPLRTPHVLPDHLRARCSTRRWTSLWKPRFASSPLRFSRGTKTKSLSVFGSGRSFNISLSS